MYEQCEHSVQDCNVLEFSTVSIFGDKFHISQNVGTHYYCYSVQSWPKFYLFKYFPTVGSNFLFSNFFIRAEDSNLT